jgi:chromosome segregation ATPase
MKLYEISERLRALIDSIDSAETPEAYEAAQAEIERTLLTRDEKLEACCAYDRELRAEIEVLEGEIGRLKDLKTAAEKKLTAWREYMARCVGVGEKWKSAKFSIGWRKSRGVIVTDGTQIPSIYLREKIEIDRETLKKDLECGATIPGALLEERNNIQIR